MKAIWTNLIENFDNSAMFVSKVVLNHPGQKITFFDYLLQSKKRGKYFLTVCNLNILFYAKLYPDLWTCVSNFCYNIKYTKIY